MIPLEIILFKNIKLLHLKKIALHSYIPFHNIGLVKNILLLLPY